MPTKRQSEYTTKDKDSSSKNMNKSPSPLSPNNVFHSNDSRSHSSRTASVKGKLVWKSLSGVFNSPKKLTKTILLEVPL